MFKKKNAVGIFLGPHGVSIVEATRKGKAKNYIFSLYPKDITKPGGAIAPKDNIFDVFLDNEEEIVAFLNKTLRESRIDLENSEVVICIPNRDLIVRFFEIPPIPKKEIDTSIGFEIKKYIPFKTEEITYDYQTHSQKNIIEVLFAGIKNEDLEKYNSILTQLKVNILAIEPSQFSLLRLLKIGKIITNKESVVVVELEEEEGAISIVDNAVPCFSRDIRISSGLESTEVDIETLSFRLINEVRVSIDYFRRQFLKKGIDRIIILSKDESKELISNFNKELGMPVQYQNPDDIFGAKEEHSLNLAKAMGASFRANKPSSLTINFAKKQKTAAMALLGPQQMISEAFEEILDIPKATIIKTLSFALVVLLAIFFWGYFKIGPVKQELNAISRDASSKLTGDLKGLNIKKLESFKEKIGGDLAVYKNVFKKDLLISEKLEVLAGLLPEGVWFEEISFDRSKKLILFRGMIYGEDDKAVADAPYIFISNLKNSPLFSNRIVDISVKSLRTAFEKNYKVSKFEIEIKLGI